MVSITNNDRNITFTFSDGEVISIDKNNADVLIQNGYVVITNADSDGVRGEDVRLRYDEVSSPSVSSNGDLYDLLTGYIDTTYTKTIISDGTNDITLHENLNEEGFEVPVSLKSHKCLENSTTVALGADEVFTGEWQPTTDYGIVLVSSYSDQASATDGLHIQFGTDVNGTITYVPGSGGAYSMLADDEATFSEQTSWDYFRVVYTNGSVAQNTFYLVSTLKRVYVKPSSHRIQDAIDNEDDAELMKSVITGQRPNGVFDNVQITNGGNFKTSLEEIENDVSEDSNTTLRTTILVQDEYGNITRILGDNIFKGALITIPAEHHEIHCADSYEASLVEVLGNGDTLDVLIIVPNEGLTETEPGLQQDKKQYHFKGNVESELDSTVEFFEGVAVTDNGTQVDVFNRNRNASPAIYNDFLGVYTAPTVTSTGTRLLVKRIGSGKKVGGSETRADELILKDNTIYLLRVTNNITTDNYVDIGIDYYVHPGV